MQRTALQVSIKEFGEIVKNERAQGGYFVNGLVIRKSDNPFDIKKIITDLPENILCEISQNSDDKKIVSQIKSAFENKKWLIFYLSDGVLLPAWREQLMRLRNSNHVFIQAKSFADTFFAEQPKETRIVAVIDEKNIKEVEYPQFLNLFGPVIEM